MDEFRRLTRSRSIGMTNCEMTETLTPNNVRSRTDTSRGQCPYQSPPGFGFTMQTRQYYRNRQRQYCYGNGKTVNATRRPSIRHLQCADVHIQSESTSCNVPTYGIKQLSTIQNEKTLTAMDIECDAIIPNAIHWHDIDGPPMNISENFATMEPDGSPSLPATLSYIGKDKTKGPYEASAIRIIHENQDSDQGDEFGATLRTYETIVNDERIRQHYLVDVVPRGPAHKMKIKDDDEIALLNDFFVPEKTHNEVIDLFHHVRVDGKTRFQLVIRRISEKGRNKSSGMTYEWMETSAILAPDSKQILNQPIVEKVEFKPLGSDGYRTKDYKRYRTRHRGLFIDISEHGLIANTNASTNGDRTKIIVKRVHYTQNRKGYLTWYASLSDIDEKRYIFIGNDGVTLKEHPDWFTVCDHKDGAIGSNVFFRKNEIYLACNENTGKIVVSTKPYRFDEIPGHVGVDRLDRGTGFTRDYSTSDTTPVRNPTRPNTRSLQLPLNTGKPRRNEKKIPTEIKGNNLVLSESSSQNLSTSEMETEDDRANNFTTHLTLTPLKTPTTPMMSLCINK